MESMRIDSSGNVGIGVTSPAYNLDVRGSNNVYLAARATGSANNTTAFIRADTDGVVFGQTGTSATPIIFDQAGTERLRIDSSGNVGIGVSSPLDKLDVSGNLRVGQSQISSDSTVGVVGIYGGMSSNTSNSQLRFFGKSVSNTGQTYEIARISGSSFSGSGYSLDGGLQFSVASNNGSNVLTLTECLRIDSSGNVLIGKTSTDVSVAGSYFEQSGRGRFSTNNSLEVLTLNRQDNDGTIVEIRQANTVEGTISVSGTTVSYNGGHLSRFSQLPSGQRDPSIKKGTVLSNLDEMCVWNDAEGNPLPNEQLNKVKISDVEGDGNVAGVFVNWDNDDQDNPFDLNMAMTGDMIIRIAQGVTVSRGDLLMSAGDGTAKPQGDDTRKAKTIAKVTSTNVTCTYEDGSYCVPCVLMAC